MIISRRFHRLNNNEHLPVILLAIAVIYVIHLCNRHDERTANQYIMEDSQTNDDHQRCPLYPSTLQGLMERHLIFRMLDVFVSSRRWNARYERRFIMDGY